MLAGLVDELAQWGVVPLPVEDPVLLREVLGAVELRGELLRARRHDVRHHQQQLVRQASKVLGWPKRCQLAPAFLWEYSYKRLELVQLLVQLGVFLTLGEGRTDIAPHPALFCIVNFYAGHRNQICPKNSNVRRLSVVMTVRRTLV